MTIANDLGVCIIPGKNKTPRHYYEVLCEECGEGFIVRADTPRNYCTSCSRVKVQQRKIQAAIEILDAGEKKCSVCKEIKPLEAFGTKSQIFSGYRSACKDCRYEAEKITNAKYKESVRGKLCSANSQGYRREKLYKTADNSITTDTLQQLRLNQNNCCFYCKGELNYSTPKQVHLDHIIPLSAGGTHTLSNVAWTCAYCNLTKNNKIAH